MKFEENFFSTMRLYEPVAETRTLYTPIRRRWKVCTGYAKALQQYAKL